MAKITTHEAMPFPLAKPNSDTFVTESENIGWGDKALPQAIDEKNDANSATGNSNATNIEYKMNALIGCIQLMIQSVVFHSGTPFVSPQELDSQLELLRYPYSANTSALCGTAICGKTICGTI